jgi:MFS family permease
VERDVLKVVPEAAAQAGITALPRRGGSARALHSQPFRLYFAGQVASASGTFLQQTAIGWLVLQLTHSAADLGLVLAAGGVPSLLLGPWGGSIADRVDLRKLLIATQIAFALLAALLWAVAAAGAASVGLIVAVNVASGFVSIADSPARQAFVSRLVPPADLASAVSLNGVVVNSARVVGPAIAGALIVTVGTTPCFAVNAVSYLAVIGALAAVHPLPESGKTSKSSGGVREGVRYARSRQQLWLPLTMMALVGLFAFNFAVILPVLASKTFHGSGGTYGTRAGSRWWRRPPPSASASSARRRRLTSPSPAVPWLLPAPPRSHSSLSPRPLCSCTPRRPSGAGSWRCSCSSTSARPPSEACSPAGSAQPPGPVSPCSPAQRHALLPQASPPWSTPRPTRTPP